MTERITDPWFFDNNADMLGFDWGPVIGQAVGAGISAGVPLLVGSQQGSGGPRPLRGSGLIDQMAAEYHAMEASGATPQDLIRFAQAALTVLNDPQYAPWDNPAYHAQAIEVMSNTIRVLQGRIGTGGGGGTIPAQTPTPGATPPPIINPATGQPSTIQTVINPATGQPVTIYVPITADDQIFGIDTKTLLLIGGGLIALILLMSSGKGQ